VRLGRIGEPIRGANFWNLADRVSRPPVSAFNPNHGPGFSPPKRKKLARTPVNHFPVRLTRNICLEKSLFGDPVSRTTSLGCEGSRISIPAFSQTRDLFCRSDSTLAPWPIGPISAVSHFAGCRPQISDHQTGLSCPPTVRAGSLPPGGNSTETGIFFPSGRESPADFV